MTDQGTSDPASQEPTGTDPAAVSNPSEPASQEPTGGGEPKKYAGRYNTPEELEAAFQSQQKTMTEKDQEIQRLRQANPPRQESQPQPQDTDPEVEAAAKFVDERVKSTLSPFITKMEEMELRNTYSDFDKMKDGIAEVRNKYPQVSLADAYEIAKGKANYQQLQSVVTSDNEGAQAAQVDKAKAATVSQGGTQPKGSQGLTPQDVMAMPADEYRRFIASPAGEEYLRKRASGEL